jgi:hypothetical protein
MARTMSRPAFAYSKSALVFAGLTMAGTLMLVGPSEGGGLLDRTVKRFGQQREAITEEPQAVSTEPAKVIEPVDPAAGWGGAGGSVFGDYNPQEPPPASEIDRPASIAPEQPRPNPGNLAPSATQMGGPVRADSLGELVPRDGAEAGQRVGTGTSPE